MDNSIAVIAAHPDDEVLGCGGTIARHAENGEEVNILILAEGQTSRSNLKNNNKLYVSKLKEIASLSTQILGANSIELLDLPDNKLDTLSRLEIIKVIEDFITRHNPKTVYTHHSGDVNIDHQIIHHAVVTAVRPMPNSNIRNLFSFEVPSSTEWQTPTSSNIFQPNYFVSIKEQWEKKKKALELYKLEMRDWPHPRSFKNVEILSQFRGSQVGLEKAEAFISLRQIK